MLTAGGAEAATTMTLTAPAGTHPAPPVAWGVSVYDGEYQEQFRTSTLSIEAGQVDAAFSTGSSVEPPTVTAPMLHNPGSQLTLHGAGFCPASRVAIGDATEGAETENDAAAESISSDGTALTFRVPRGAVSGPITVVPPRGSAFHGRSLTVRSFRNTEGFSWPNKDYGMRFDDQLGDEMFGRDEMNIEPVPGWLVRKPEAVLFETMANNHIPGGICFGMAYSSLELAEFPGEVSRFPRTGGDDPWHLDSAGEPSQALLRYVTQNFAMQFTDQLIPAEVNAVIGIHGTNDYVNTIEEELAAGHPVMIGLIHWNGLSIEAHSVLAYDSRPNPAGGTTIYVANSNVPYETGEESNAEQHNSSQFTRSQIVIKEGNWVFPEGADFKNSGGQPWSGAEADMVVYRHHELPVINGERPHLPNLFTSTVMAVFGSAGDGVTQLSDGRGSLFEGGKLAPRGSWPTGVAPLADFNGAAGPLQLVSFQPSMTGPLTATVARASGGGAMSLTLPGLQASLQANVHPGQVDHVRVDPHTDAVSYQTTAPSVVLGGTLLSAPGAAAGARAAAPSRSALSDRLVQFQLASGRGGGETLAFPQGGTLSLHHSGAPTNVSLTLSSFAPSGQPVAVRLPSVRLAGGATLEVSPKSWRALTGAPVSITVSLHGHSTHRLVRGRTVGRRFATVRSASLKALGGRRYQLSMLLGFRGTPRQASLSVGASVLLGGRLVERAAANQLTGAELQRASALLALPRPLAPGRYTLRLRLLETTRSGAVQGSVVVSRALTVRAG